MEQIEALFILAQNNSVAVFFIGVLATFVESFIPALPLIAIVVTSAALQGFIKGTISSVIGSVLGTILLYLLSSKFSHIPFFEKYKTSRIDKITKWIRRQHYIVIYLCYSSPFVPSCLLSIASGYSQVDYKEFALGMIMGKVTMFVAAGYIGYDIEGLINNPEKIIIILVMILVSYIIGKVITNKMNKNILD